MPYKLIVAGGREMKDRQLVYKYLNKINTLTDNLEIVSGLCRGPDMFAKDWGEANGVPVKKFPANWNKYGKPAGHIRNEQMARYGDALLLFWDGKSPGSKNMLSNARKYQLKYKIVYVKY
jgi:hypothetical protein